MTIVVALLCSDGVVVAADSMISHGSMSLPYLPGKKIEILCGEQIYAFSGDLGLGARFRSVADGTHTAINSATDQSEYPHLLSQRILENFQSTRIMNDTDRARDIDFGLQTVLAYGHGDACRCCVFNEHMQFRLLTEDYFYQALGSGVLSARPFLHFLVKDVFRQDHGSLNVRAGELIAIWTIKHVIATNAGGVGYPIHVATLKRGDGQGVFVAQKFTATDKLMWDHNDSIRDALQALRDWKDSFMAVNQDSPPERNEG